MNLKNLKHICCMLFKYHLSADKFASSLGNGYRLLRYCTPSNDQVNMFGRSMIEMLGVLAIIGVLSVSGIAGYSKAMEKYKVNKAIDEYTYLIYGLLEHLDEIKYSTKLGDGKLTPIVKLANDLNLVPSTWL